MATEGKVTRPDWRSVSVLTFVMGTYLGLFVGFMIGWLYHGH